MKCINVEAESEAKSLVPNDPDDDSDPDPTENVDSNTCSHRSYSRRG